MQAQSAGRTLARPPERARTLVASNGAVWIWPGIPLTMRRGAEIVPVAETTIRFWVSRLHGPEALDRNLSRAVAYAAERLAADDEVCAQWAIDALQLTELSQDGASLSQAIADSLGVPAPDLPLRATLRTWNEHDIALHLPLFKLHAEAARHLAKGIIPFDPEKHPRWEAGAPDSQGGRFAPAGGSDASVIPVAARRPKRPKRLPPLGLGEHLTEPPKGIDGEHLAEPPKGIGHNSDKFPEIDIPEEEPHPDDRYDIVTEIGQKLQELLAQGFRLWVRNLLLGLEAISWMKKKSTNYYYQIVANLDPPKTLKELQDAVKRPTLGYHVHHIVEWNTSDNKFSVDQLENPENLVEIPEMTHRKISDWYRDKNARYKIDGKIVSPREYLKSKSWKEQYDFGIQVLKDFGVLKR